MAVQTHGTDTTDQSWPEWPAQYLVHNAILASEHLVFRAGLFEEPRALARKLSLSTVFAVCKFVVCELSELFHVPDFLAGGKVRNSLLVHR